MRARRRPLFRGLEAVGGLLLTNTLFSHSPGYSGLSPSSLLPGVQVGCWRDLLVVLLPLVFPPAGHSPAALPLVGPSLPSVDRWRSVPCLRCLIA